MPTSRRRITITETDDVAAALDAAAARWPDVRSRAELLLRLVEEAHHAIVADREATARQREAVARTHGALTGAYEPNCLARLREDWPAR